MGNGRTNAPGLIVGLCFMALGVLLLGDRMGLIRMQDALEYWPAALILLGGSLIVQAVRGAGDGTQRSSFPVGAVIWLVLIGFFLSNVFERRSGAERGEGDRVHLFAVLSGDKRASASREFRGAEMTSFMGGTELDLRDATMAPGAEAIIDVFAMMGGAVVYVPRHWVVDVQTTAVMGGVKDERFETPREGRPRRGRGRGSVAPEPGDSPDQGRIAGSPDAPNNPEVPEFPELPDGSPPAPPLPPQIAEPVERDDSEAPVNPPRIVLRGFVMMGGLAVKS